MSLVIYQNVQETYKRFCLPETSAASSQTTLSEVALRGSVDGSVGKLAIHEDLDLILRTHIKTTTNQNPKVDMVDCAYDPSILETDKQQIPRAHWPSQPSLLSELQASTLGYGHTQ